MRITKLIANAKINFTLDIKGKREDGYHLIDSVMQSVSLYDTVNIEKSEEISVGCSDGEILGESNIAFKAAKEFFDFVKIKGGADIFIEKHIPKAAGLGGGSADAAAVIVGLDKIYKTELSAEKLCEIGLKVGADVPFCIIGGTIRATGIGEVLDCLPHFPKSNLVIVKNGEKLSTKAMYEEIDSKEKMPSYTDKFIENHIKGETEKALKNCGNAFETVCKIDNIKDIALEFSPICISLSGSGPSVFAVFKEKETAVEFSKRLSKIGFEPYLTTTTDVGIKEFE